MKSLTGVVLVALCAITMLTEESKAQFFIKAPLAKHVPAGTTAKNFKTDEVITIKTDLGEIVMLLSDRTPVHKANFLKLIDNGTYEGTTFHRIIKNFMIQGGDPNSKDTIQGNEGAGNVGYTIPAEFDDSLSHVQGAVAAARMGDQVNPNRESSGCQFYIVDGEKGAHFLNMQYTVFGKVIKGIDVVQAIAGQAKDYRDKPLKDIKMSVSYKKMKRSEIESIYGIKYR